MKEYTPWAKHIVESENHPLLGDGISSYINDPETRKALHVPDSLPGWEQCAKADDEGGIFHYEL